MHALELKIPPVALALLIALAMWGAPAVFPSADLPLAVRAFIGIVCGVAGMAVILAGIVSIRRARTTINPTKPDSASTLVTSGIYRHTRNPMYLGVVFALVGWAAFLANALALVGAFAFAAYMNRFQIAPEERALAAIFGAEYAAYTSRVRRWL